MAIGTDASTPQRSIFDDTPSYRGLATRFGWRAWVTRALAVLLGVAALVAQEHLYTFYGL